MTSKEALYLLMTNQKKVRDDFTFIDLNTHEKVSIEECYDIVIKDLEILECFKKIDKKELNDFIETQIKYTLNENSWLSACNCDLEKEEPTQHLIKIKEWLENDI